MQKIFKNLLSGYRIVYVDYALRQSGQFLVFSILVKSLNLTQFADYNFYITLSTYIALVVNAGFDSLINLTLADKEQANFFYVQSLKLKIALYLVFGLVLLLVLNIPITDFILFAFFSVSFVFLEHLDIRMRFLDNYRPVLYRVYFSLFFLGAKIYFALLGDIVCLLWVSIIEILLYIYYSLCTIKFKMFFGGEIDFIRQYGKKITKVSIGGFLIFSFLQLDQFLIYQFMQKEDYAVYALACKFFAIFTALVGVYARYMMPKLYTEQLGYFTVLKKLLSINAFVFMIVAFVFYIYLRFWIQNYLDAIWLLWIFGLASLGLIFGQVRNVYFVKKHNFMPDIYNALLGIMVLAGLFFYVSPVQVSTVAIFYLCGVLVSGLFSTLLYRDGWHYLRRLKGDYYGR